VVISEGHFDGMICLGEVDDTGNIIFAEDQEIKVGKYK
jgi:hypothetical protein